MSLCYFKCEQSAYVFRHKSHLWGSLKSSYFSSFASCQGYGFKGGGGVFSLRAFGNVWRHRSFHNCEGSTMGIYWIEARGATKYPKNAWDSSLQQRSTWSKMLIVPKLRNWLRGSNSSDRFWWGQFGLFIWPVHLGTDSWSTWIPCGPEYPFFSHSVQYASELIQWKFYFRYMFQF